MFPGVSETNGGREGEREVDLNSLGHCCVRHVILMCMLGHTVAAYANCGTKPKHMQLPLRSVIWKEEMWALVSPKSLKERRQRRHKIK